MSLKQYNVKVTVDKVTTDEDIKLTKGAYGYELTFNFVGDIWNNLIKKAVFNGVEIAINNNKCIIPLEATKETGKIKLGVYGYNSNGEILILRASPYPTPIKVLNGSYDSSLKEATLEGSGVQIPTPTNHIELLDTATGIKHKLYVENGKLCMEVLA